MSIVWKESTNEWLPIGIHEGEFAGFEVLEAKGEFKEAIQFKFNANGKMAGNIGAIPPTAKNVAGKLIVGLLGKTPETGQNIEDQLKACVGQKYTLVVSNNKNGRPVVVQVAAKK
jgi:hypothetical protein